MLTYCPLAETNALQTTIGADVGRSSHSAQGQSSAAKPLFESLIGRELAVSMNSWVRPLLKCLQPDKELWR